MYPKGQNQAVNRALKLERQFDKQIIPLIPRPGCPGTRGAVYCVKEPDGRAAFLQAIPGNLGLYQGIWLLQFTAERK